MYSVYTTNSFGGKELVLIPEEGTGRFVDEKGQKLEAQKTAGGYEVLVEAEPFGAAAVKFEPAEDVHFEAEDTSGDSFSFDGNTLETPIYTISWNEDGQLTEIFDKEADRSVLKEGQPGNVLEIYEE